MNRLLYNAEVPRSAMSARWSTINYVFPLLALIQGLLVLIGGSDRWRGSSLEIMMDGFNNAHWLVGAVLALVGMLLIISLGADWPFSIWLSAWICALWYFSAMGCTIAQLIKTPGGVGTLGPVAWFAFGLIHVIQAQGRVRQKCDAKPVEGDVSEQNL